MSRKVHVGFLPDDGRAESDTTNLVPSCSRFNVRDMISSYSHGTRQMNKFTPSWMEPRVIRSILDDAALSIASSALSGMGMSCHNQRKACSSFDIQIRVLPRYIKVTKEIRAVSDENFALQSAKPAKPFHHLETKETRRVGYLSWALPLRQRRDKEV